MAIPGNVVDLRGSAEEIVRAAGWAPSHHNAQPWRFRVAAREVQVWADRSRRIPLADPNDRQLFVGVGAAVLGVRLALSHRGMRAVVRLARDPARPDLAAVVTAAAGRVGTEDDRLYAALPHRRTVREAFTDDPVPVPMQVRLGEVARLEGARLRWIVRESARRDLAAVIMAAELAQQSAPDFRAELDRWVSTAAGRDTGIPANNIGTTLAAGRLGEFPLRDFAGPRAGLPVPSPRTEARPGIAVLCTPGDQRADWLRAGQALHRVLLEASTTGLAASFLNQPLEFPRLRRLIGEEMRPDGYPQMILRLGRPCGPLPPATPRRPVSDALLPPEPSPAGEQ